MIVRRWTQADIEKIYALEQVCFKSPWSLNSLTDVFKLNNFYGLLVEVEGEIVAYVGCVYDNWDADVLNVATSPNHRKKGYAQKLLDDVIVFLQTSGKERVFLEVRASNLPAQNLYVKMGFSPIGIRKNYYENTEDAIVMAKVLKG